MPTTSPWLWLLSFVAGVVSFTSPCVLPLLPGYLSFITGVERTRVGTASARWAVLWPCLLFVSGFSLVFTALGASASTLGELLRDHLFALQDIAGVFILFMALVVAGIIRIPALMGDYGLHLERRPSGVLGSLILGMAFAVCWTPCVGPVLAAVLAVASGEQTATRGALLLLVYSAGLGVPFVLSGLFLSRIMAAFGAVRRRMQLMSYAGAGVLALMGVLLIAHRWVPLLAPLLRLYANLNWPPV